MYDPFLSLVPCWSVVVARLPNTALPLDTPGFAPRAPRWSGRSWWRGLREDRERWSRLIDGAATGTGNTSAIRRKYEHLIYLDTLLGGGVAESPSGDAVSQYLPGDDFSEGCYGDLVGRSVQDGYLPSLEPAFMRNGLSSPMISAPPVKRGVAPR